MTSREQVATTSPGDTGRDDHHPSGQQETRTLEEIMDEFLRPLNAWIASGQPDEWGFMPTDARGPRGIPTQTAPFVVYAFFTPRDICLYVGQTSALFQRVTAHRDNRAPFWHITKTVRILATAQTRDEARDLEREWIQRLDPLCNIQHSPSNRPSGRAA